MKNLLLIFTIFSSILMAEVSFASDSGRKQDDGSVSGGSELFYYWIYQWNEFGEWEEILVEGFIQSSADGTSAISWMWILDGTSVELIQLFPDSPADPHYKCEVHALGSSRKLITVTAINYPKGSPTSNRFLKRGQPLPNGVVILETPAISNTFEGWSWGGWMLSFDRIEDDSGGECKEPNAGVGGERYVIPISDTEILIIIINEDGTVTVLVYRLGADGCWRFGVTPDTYVPPPLPGFTGPQSVSLALTEYLYQYMHGHFQSAPPFPVY